MRGDLVLVAGVIVEYLLGSSPGELVKDYISSLKPGERIHCSINTISEVYYVLCRMNGKRHPSSLLHPALFGMKAVRGITRLVLYGIGLKYV